MNNLVDLLNPEDIAYWFFRLNGCTTITDFVVHPDRKGSQRTDVDVLAVRFPHRAELLTSGEPMVDHPVFTSDGRIEIILAEIKHGMCRLNGPWTDPQLENMFRVLYAIGAFERKQVPEVARELYQEAEYSDYTYRMRLFAVGERRNPEIIPNAVQIVWDDILIFIYERLMKYRIQKSHHAQWDRTGTRLYDLAVHHTKDDFIGTVTTCMDHFFHQSGPSRTE